MLQHAPRLGVTTIYLQKIHFPQLMGCKVSEIKIISFHHAPFFHQLFDGVSQLHDCGHIVRDTAEACAQTRGDHHILAEDPFSPSLPSVSRPFHLKDSFSWRKEHTKH